MILNRLNLNILKELVFILFLSLLLVGCESEKDEYYVKYEVDSTTIYINGKLTLLISTESNPNSSMSIDQRVLREIVIGPVEKDFEASLILAAQGNTFDQLRLYANIYVSKNGSPFALKKSDESDDPRDYLEMSYQIDY